jgi:hypothetical protein
MGEIVVWWSLRVHAPGGGSKGTGIGSGGSAVIGRDWRMARPALAVEGPLDVLGGAERRLEAPDRTGDLAGPGVVEDGLSARRVAALSRPCLALDLLASDGELLGGDLAAHESIPEPVDGVDDHLVAGAGDRVGREGHSRGDGLYLALHEERHRLGPVSPVAPNLVGSGRGVAGPEGLGERLPAPYVQHGQELACEAALDPVLGDAGGPDGEWALSQ